MSGERTGRSPKDKRIVKEESTEGDIWWGNINVPMTEDTFEINKCRAIDYLNTKDRLFVVDAYAGMHNQYRMKIRIISTRAYHALFMENMLKVAEGKELGKKKKKKKNFTFKKKLNIIFFFFKIISSQSS